MNENNDNGKDDDEGRPSSVCRPWFRRAWTRMPRDLVEPLKHAQGGQTLVYCTLPLLDHWLRTLGKTERCFYENDLRWLVTVLRCQMWP